MKAHRIIKAFPAFDIRIAIKRKIHDDPLLLRSNLRFYASGRSSLYYLVKSLNLLNNDVILLPSFHCGVEVEAVLRAGCKVRFYKVNRDLSMDLADILKKMDSNTKGIVLVHYFGFPQDISHLKSVCSADNIVLIEDCAHALYSRNFDGAWLGTQADFGIFSMRKTTYLPNGGAVLVNTNGLNMPQKGKKYFELSMIKSIVKSILEHEINVNSKVHGIASFILDMYKRRESTNTDTKDEYDNSRWYYKVPMFHYENDISILSSILLRYEDYRNIIDIRRKNYIELEKRLSGKFKAQFLFKELPDGICPLCFPLIVKQRDVIVSHMIEQGVEPFVFGRLLHPLINSQKYPESKYLADSIIGLPLHQQLSGEDIATVSNVLFRVLESNRVR